MTEAYDHNQTVVPDSFLMLYVKGERLTLSRAELEARSDFCDSLALQAADRVPQIAADDATAQQSVLRRIWQALNEAPAQVSAAEAGWVVGRIAELHEWVAPDLRDGLGSPP